MHKNMALSFNLGNYNVIQQDIPRRTFITFLILSLLLHIIFLFVIRPFTKRAVNIPQSPIVVYFDTTPSAKQPPVRNSQISTTPNSPAKAMSPSTRTIQLAAPSDASLSQLLEAAHDLARDEARASEQLNAVQEKKKLSTPVATLEQYLRMPHKELRLANGTLKITTEAGEVCFQNVPDFARDHPELFSIPITCP